MKVPATIAVVCVVVASLFGPAMSAAADSLPPSSEAPSAGDVDDPTTDQARAESLEKLTLGSYCATNGDTGKAACVDDVTDQNREEKLAEAKSLAEVGPGNRASIIVAQLWDDINGGGSGISFYGSASCSGGVLRASSTDLAVSHSFNNKTSSMYGYASCTVTIWEDAGYYGASLMGSYNYVGSTMNDKATSVKVR